MARYPRVYSETGYYHIVLKGIDKKLIFLDEQDKTEFLCRLYEAKGKGGFNLLAYCLMDNHIHLVIKEHESIGKSVQRFTVSYVYYFHQKYGTSGHFFNNRFHSDPIYDEEYFKKAIRYTHQNPVKAGMVERIEDYRWSSYPSYINTYNCKDCEDDLGIVIAMIPSIKEFQRFHLSYDDWFEISRLERDKRLMNRLVEEEGYDLNTINRIERMHLIVKINKTMHVQGSVIADFFGINKKTVYRVLQQFK